MKPMTKQTDAMISRRLFVTAGAAALVLPASAVRAAIDANPFTLGIASGSPQDTNIILWTRLALAPLVGGGMPAATLPVHYLVCADAAMRKVVRQGTIDARPEDAHSVHLKVEGLQPGREYWYRFAVGEYTSATGRTRTSNARDANARLVLASCQAWETGYYAAYADIAAWAPDCVIHVGDYIYEGGIAPLGPVQGESNGDTVRHTVVRQHNSAEIVSLYDYRNRYAQYRQDASLQAAHAASPWIMAMDDHEIDNNWAGDVPQDPDKQTALEFKVRKLAALKAYWEHMPIEQPPEIAGLQASLRMHGLYRFGPAQVHLLDTRQFRSDQACSDPFIGNGCAELADPARTMLGSAQEAWLFDALGKSAAPFNVLASQTWLAPYRHTPVGAPFTGNTDQWDGYPVARQRLLDVLSGVANPVAITGDWHCAAAHSLTRNADDPASMRIGHEFSGTSISSVCPWAGQMERSQVHNPQTRYFNGRQRGYTRFTVDHKRWTTEFRVVADVTNPVSAVVTDREIRTSDI
jgi:alkaline phosphatase D